MIKSAEHDCDFHDGYVGVSPIELEVMADSELAQWQHSHSSEPPMVILAEHEWQRRRMMRALVEQFKLEERVKKIDRWWMLSVAFIGVMGTLAGAYMGAQWESSANATGASVKPQVSPQPTAQADAPQRAVPAPVRR